MAVGLTQTPIAKVQTASREVNQLQTNISQAFYAFGNQLIANPVLNGYVISNLVLNSGANTVPHNLGRAVVGYLPVRFIGSFAQIFDTQNSNQTPQTTLLLNASALVTVDLYVF